MIERTSDTMKVVRWCLEVLSEWRFKLPFAEITARLMYEEQVKHPKRRARLALMARLSRNRTGRRWRDLPGMDVECSTYHWGHGRRCPDLRPYPWLCDACKRRRDQEMLDFSEVGMLREGEG